LAAISASFGFGACVTVVTIASWRAQKRDVATPVRRADDQYLFAVQIEHLHSILQPNRTGLKPSVDPSFGTTKVVPSRGPQFARAASCANYKRTTYRNFNVVTANSAKTSAAIQKRTMTLDSLQPINSK